MDYIQIPPERLDRDVYVSVLEEYINREGTDYGIRELSMNEKMNNLMVLVDRGEVLIVFDPANESCTVMTREDLVRESSTEVDSQAVD